VTYCVQVSCVCEKLHADKFPNKALKSPPCGRIARAKRSLGQYGFSPTVQIPPNPGDTRQHDKMELLRDQNCVLVVGSVVVDRLSAKSAKAKGLLGFGPVR
ncbi:MAG: hypothetical protein AAGH38_02520, partial [Pseudomonadota bacterium]